MMIEAKRFKKQTKRIVIVIWGLYFLVATLIYLISPSNLIFVVGEISWLVVHSVGSFLWWRVREDGFECVKCGNKCEDASIQSSNVNAVKSIVKHCSICQVDYQLGVIGDNDPMP